MNRTLLQPVDTCLPQARISRPVYAVSSPLPTPTPVPAQTSPGPVETTLPTEADIFVGREREMAVLQTALTHSIAGRGQLVLIAGEPGIGKTRLLEECAHLAQQYQARVLWGWGWEGDGAPAFWPWMHLVRAALQPEIRDTFSPELAASATDLNQFLPDVWEQQSLLPGASECDPAYARFRFFDRLTTFFKQLGRQQPLLLLLDDLHWADMPSLRLLHFFAREIRDAPLCVVGTYRDVGVSRSHPLSLVLGDVLREAQALTLSGLSLAEVARFVTETSGAIPAASLVAAVHTQTDGNPFFVREMVRFLAAEGRSFSLDGMPAWPYTVPQGIRETIRHRLARLSEPCAHLLTVAAVIGREFSLELLLQSQGKDAGEERATFLAWVDEALAARILQEVPDRTGYYCFLHGLVRETLYEEMPLSERIRVHRQVGETIERLQGTVVDAALAELANHFVNAAPGGTSAQALQYTIAAGQQAMTLLAYEKAVTYYEQALQLLTLQEAHPLRQCALLLALGEALWGTGENPRARTTFLQAAHLAQTIGAPDLLAQAALGVSTVRLQTGDVDDTLVGLLSTALDALPGEPSALRVRLLARLVEALYFSSDAARQQALSVEMLAMAQQVDDERAIASALSARHFVLWGPDRVSERLALATEIIQRAEGTGRVQMILDGLTYAIIALFEVGDIAAVDRNIARYDQQGAALRLPRWRWRLLVMRAAQALFAGHFEDGERLATEAYALREAGELTKGISYFAAQMFVLRREQGRLAELAPMIVHGATRLPALFLWRCALAVLHSELGDRGAAQQEFERLAAHDFDDLPRGSHWLPALVYLAEVCCFLEDHPRAARLHTLLQPYAERNVVVGTAAVGYGVVARYLGLLSTLQADWEGGVAYFETALRRHTQMGARPWMAHTQYDYAQMLVSRSAPGDAEHAVSLLQQASRSAAPLGMTRLCGRIEALQRQCSHRVVPPRVVAPPAPHDAVFRQDEKQWILGFAGQTIRHHDVKGLHYLAYLLQHPGQEVHVFDLLALTDAPAATRRAAGLASLSPHELNTSSFSLSSLPAGRPLPDAQARAAYRDRLQSLQADLEEAERHHDVTGKARLQAEIDVLTDALTSAYGARRYARSAADATEKARKAVSNRIRSLLANLQPLHPPLWQHLFASLKTGTFCVYRPEPPISWRC